jgi:hypothetical protein
VAHPVQEVLRFVDKVSQTTQHRCPLVTVDCGPSDSPSELTILSDPAVHDEHSRFRVVYPQFRMGKFVHAFSCLAVSTICRVRSMYLRPYSTVSQIALASWISFQVSIATIGLSELTAAVRFLR